MIGFYVQLYTVLHKAVPWLCQREAWVQSQGFLEGRVQCFHQVLQFSPASQHSISAPYSFVTVSEVCDRPTQLLH
jgi:hypothetical protein